MGGAGIGSSGGLRGLSVDNQEGAVDRDEVARRLEKIRAVVRDELAMREPAVFDDSVRDEVPVYLHPGLSIILTGDPGLSSTADLEAANQAADILAVEPSKTRVFGPLIDLLRRLSRPLVTIFVGGQLARQQQFNAHAVRHMNDLDQATMFCWTA